MADDPVLLLGDQGYDMGLQRTQGAHQISFGRGVKGGFIHPAYGGDVLRLLVSDLQVRFPIPGDRPLQLPLPIEPADGGILIGCPFMA